MWLLALVMETAWPCAGLVHESEALAESEHGQALFEVLDGEVDAEFRVVYSGDAEDFGWLIPVFGNFVALEDGDVTRFEDLDEATAPMVVHDEPERSGRGCACGDSGGLKNDRGGEELGVDVVAEGYTGTYDYQILDAADGTAMSDWLAANGWELGGAEEDVTAYADEGFLFAAIRVHPTDPHTADGGRDLPPVRITWEGDTVRFPSRMALHATATEQRTTVFVVDDDATTLTSGWEEQHTDRIEIELDADPIEEWENHLRIVASDGPAFHRTTVMGWDGRTVTRFDALAPRGVHTVDAVFGPESGVGDVSTEIFVTEEPNQAALFWLGGLALLGGALARRRRR